MFFEPLGFCWHFVRATLVTWCVLSDPCFHPTRLADPRGRDHVWITSSDNPWREAWHPAGSLLAWEVEGAGERGTVQATFLQSWTWIPRSHGHLSLAGLASEQGLAHSKYFLNVLGVKKWMDGAHQSQWYELYPSGQCTSFLSWL